nr:hypothetical protein CFP56_69609 [Quercus suber]
MPPLGKLPLLKSLTIKSFYGLKKVGVEFLGIESKNKKDDILFPNFKTLLFVNLGYNSLTALLVAQWLGYLLQVWKLRLQFSSSPMCIIVVVSLFNFQGS